MRLEVPRYLPHRTIRYRTAPLLHLRLQPTTLWDADENIYFSNRTGLQACPSWAYVAVLQRGRAWQAGAQLAVHCGCARITIAAESDVTSVPAGGSEMLMGYTLFAMCVAEVPVFFYTGALLKRVGIDPVLHVVLGCLVLRSLAYTAMPRFAGPWLAAPVRTLSLFRLCEAGS